MKVPLDFTNVVYEANDNLGWVLSLVTLTPIYLMVMYSTLIVFRRDFGTLYAFCGQIANLVLNKILKKIIQQPRPVDSELHDFGMPSNHAQFIGFFTFFYVAQLHLNSNILPIMYRKIYIVFLLFLCVIVGYSRIYLSYHSPEQVVAGIITGALFGSCWAIAELYYGSMIGDCMCSFKLLQFFNFVDYSALNEYYQVRNLKH